MRARSSPATETCRRGARGREGGRWDVWQESGGGCGRMHVHILADCRHRQTGRTCVRLRPSQKHEVEGGFWGRAAPTSPTETSSCPALTPPSCSAGPPGTNCLTRVRPSRSLCESIIPSLRRRAPRSRTRPVPARSTGGVWRARREWLRERGSAPSDLFTEGACRSGGLAKRPCARGRGHGRARRRHGRENLHGRASPERRGARRRGHGGRWARRGASLV
jgi:hypothetical protein